MLLQENSKENKGGVKEAEDPYPEHWDYIWPFLPGVRALKLLAYRDPKQSVKPFLRLKLNIVDTIIFNEKDLPLFMLYTDEEGFLRRKDLDRNIDLIKILKKNTRFNAQAPGEDTQGLIEEIRKKRENKKFYLSETKTRQMKQLWRAKTRMIGKMVTNLKKFTPTSKNLFKKGFNLHSKMCGVFKNEKRRREKFEKEPFVIVKRPLQKDNIACNGVTLLTEKQFYDACFGFLNAREDFFAVQKYVRGPSRLHSILRACFSTIKGGSCCYLITNRDPRALQKVAAEENSIFKANYLDKNPNVNNSSNAKIKTKQKAEKTFIINQKRCHVQKMRHGKHFDMAMVQMDSLVTFLERSLHTRFEHLICDFVKGFDDQYHLINVRAFKPLTHLEERTMKVKITHRGLVAPELVATPRHAQMLSPKAQFFFCKYCKLETESQVQTQRLSLKMILQLDRFLIEKGVVSSSKLNFIRSRFFALKSLENDFRGHFFFRVCEMCFSLHKEVLKLKKVFKEFSQTVGVNDTEKDAGLQMILAKKRKRELLIKSMASPGTSQLRNEEQQTFQGPHDMEMLKTPKNRVLTEPLQHMASNTFIVSRSTNQSEIINPTHSRTLSLKIPKKLVNLFIYLEFIDNLPKKIRFKRFQNLSLRFTLLEREHIIPFKWVAHAQEQKLLSIVQSNLLKSARLLMKNSPGLFNRPRHQFGNSGARRSWLRLRDTTTRLLSISKNSFDKSLDEKHKIISAQSSEIESENDSLLNKSQMAKSSSRWSKIGLDMGLTRFSHFSGSKKESSKQIREKKKLEKNKIKEIINKTKLNRERRSRTSWGSDYSHSQPNNSRISKLGSGKIRKMLLSEEFVTSPNDKHKLMVLDDEFNVSKFLETKDINEHVEVSGQILGSGGSTPGEFKINTLKRTLKSHRKSKLGKMMNRSSRNSANNSKRQISKSKDRLKRRNSRYMKTNEDGPSNLNQRFFNPNVQSKNTNTLESEILNRAKTCDPKSKRKSNADRTQPNEGNNEQNKKQAILESKSFGDIKWTSNQVFSERFSKIAKEDKKSKALFLPIYQTKLWRLVCTSKEDIGSLLIDGRIFRVDLLQDDQKIGCFDFDLSKLFDPRRSVSTQEKFLSQEAPRDCLNFRLKASFLLQNDPEPVFFERLWAGQKDLVRMNPKVYMADPKNPFLKSLSPQMLQSLSSTCVNDYQQIKFPFSRILKNDDIVENLFKESEIACKGTTARRHSIFQISKKTKAQKIMEERQKELEKRNFRKSGAGRKSPKENQIQNQRTNVVKNRSIFSIKKPQRCSSNQSAKVPKNRISSSRPRLRTEGNRVVRFRPESSRNSGNFIARTRFNANQGNKTTPNLVLPDNIYYTSNRSERNATTLTERRRTPDHAQRDKENDQMRRHNWKKMKTKVNKTMQVFKFKELAKTPHFFRKKRISAKVSRLKRPKTDIKLFARKSVFRLGRTRDLFGKGLEHLHNDLAMFKKSKTKPTNILRKSARKPFNRLFTSKRKSSKT